MEGNLQLNLKGVVSDLTKSVVVTILALLLQFSLAVYLSHGGWQTVYPMLEKTISVNK
jgi:hypothetical protein